MTLRRYERTLVFGLGESYGTSNTIVRLRNGIEQGALRTEQYTTKENERLDIIAGQFYGDGRLWWIIAAVSQVGWGLQVPSNIRLTIPNLQDVAEIIG